MRKNMKLSNDELNAIQGCIDFALGNTDCSLDWAFENVDHDKEDNYIRILQDIQSKIKDIIDGGNA